MPLRDHFQPPLDLITSWEGFYGGWPAVIVQHLHRKLPAGFVAEPRIYLNSPIWTDAPFENESELVSSNASTAAWTPSPPNVSVATAFPELFDYEVRIYDIRRLRRLVATIEIVSPANMDRPEARHLFIAKCAALLQQGVAVSIVDLVTVWHFNLYVELLAFIGHSDPTVVDPPPDLYAATCRWTRQINQTLLEAWSHTLSLASPLPILPLWLSPEIVIPLNLEQSYEEACHDLGID